MEDEKYYLLTKGYLYYIQDGKIVELSGEIWHRDKYTEGMFITHECTYFLTRNEHGRIIKKRLCSPKEGLLYDKVIWFKKTDIPRAAEIFIEHEKLRILELEEQINKRKNIINLLSNMGR